MSYSIHTDPTLQYRTNIWVYLPMVPQVGDIVGDKSQTGLHIAICQAKNNLDQGAIRQVELLFMEATEFMADL